MIEEGVNMRKALTVAAIILVGGCTESPDATGPTEMEKRLVSSACQDFIVEQMGGKGEVDAHIFDVYKKRGKLVAEVGYRDKYDHDSAYSVRLCILDEERGTISSPSPLDDSEWKNV